ncbi:MAG TPA: beta-galactosidase [Kiritimatiellia bacterium]|nr:beta-galactosidase [Kiritimatiellia bacterium]HPS09310.1 beta-galactosidase [Kiritimatiellia bacterium]
MTRHAFCNLLCAAAALSALAGQSPAVAASPSPQSDVSRMLCEVKSHQGKPTMFVNGVPRFPMAYTSYYPEPFRYQQMGEHNVHFYSVTLTLTDKWLGGDKPVKWNTPGLWRGPDEVDLSVVETSLKKILDADPNALIFPRLFCDSPAWWDLLHPEETNGEGTLGGQARRQSFSSLVWRRDTAAAVKKIVRAVTASKFGDHVIGFMVTAGGTEELAKGIDPSACAQQRFREWLFAQYGNDAAAIGRLFGKKIEALSIPSVAECSAGDRGNFLDPQKSRLVIDYRRFHSLELVDSALAFCKAVKEGSDGRLITGLFYGYTRIWPDTGHLALRRVLDCKEVDFVTTAGGFSYTETDSVLKAGKLFYSEIDARTSLSQWISKLRPDIDPHGIYNEKRWFGPPSIPESLQRLKAVFAQNLVNGWANWWFDLWGGWYDDEAFLRMFAQMQSAGEESIGLPRKSVAQVAVFLDENSYRYLPYGVAQNGGKFAWIIAQLNAVATIGAPHDLYLLDDLADLDLARYRMIVFLNAFALSDAQRRMIRERCMTNRRLLVWMYAPGLISDTLSADNVSSLLGLDVRMEPAHPKARIAVTLPAGVTNYEGAAFSPFLHVAGGADAAVGRTAEGQVVVAEKQDAACRNLFVAMPPMPAPLLRHYARQAGVHLYCDSDAAVYANESYLAVVASGRQKVRLPKKAALKEMLSLRRGASALSDGAEFPAGTAFEMDFTEYPCRVFRVLDQ